MPTHPNQIRLDRAARLYLSLLRLYPHEFRLRFTDSAVELFRDLHSEAQQSGRHALLFFWIRTFANVIMHGTIERWSAVFSGRRTLRRSAFAGELRDAAKIIARSPRISLSVVACVALGIAATGAVLTLYRSVVLRPLPFPEEGRLVRIWNEEGGVTLRGELSYPDIEEIQQHVSSLDLFAATSRARLVFLGDGGARRVQGEGVTSDYFELFGVQPIVGRLFALEDYAYGAPATMLLAHSTWVSSYGANRNVVGSTVRTAAKPFTVIGVLPPGFRGTIENDLLDHEFWVPIKQELTTSEITRRDAGNIWTIGRLAPGATLTQADEEVRDLGVRLARAYPQARGPKAFRLEPMGENWRQTVRRDNNLLLVAAALLLAVATFNVAGLVLSRTLNRKRELAIRGALGASHARILRQLMLETFLLACLGGVAGLAAAFPLLHIFLSASPDNLPAYVDITPDGTVLAFTATLIILVAIVAGIAPAAVGGRVPPAAVLRGGNKGNTLSRGERRRTRVVVASEVALTTTLVFATGLMMRSFQAMGQVDVGYRTENLLRMAVAVSPGDVERMEQMAGFHVRLRETLLEAPGVERVALTTPALPPGYARRDDHIWFADMPETFRRDGLPVAMHAIDGEFIPTLEMQLLAGRNFANTDGSVAHPVAIVSESMANLMGGAAEAVSRTLEYDDVTYDIVGVVQDVMYQGPVKRRDVDVDLYVPLVMHPSRTTSIAIQTAGNPTTFIAPLRERLNRLAPSSALHWISPMDSEIADDLGGPLFYVLLLGAFSVSALSLTTVGLFAIVANEVALQTSEIGIRQALGAQRSQIVADTLRTVVGLVAIGLFVGAFGAGLVGNLLRTQLYGIGPLDAATVVGTAAVLLTVAAAAGFFPARRAAMTDPVVALTIH